MRIINWITGEYGEDQAEYNGRPVRNADAFAALQHEQQANTHNRGHAHCSHAHCGHQSRYERPCFCLFVFFLSGTIRKFVSFVGLVVKLALNCLAGRNWIAIRYGNLKLEKCE